MVALLEILMRYLRLLYLLPLRFSVSALCFFVADSFASAHCAKQQTSCVGEGAPQQTQLSTSARIDSFAVYWRVPSTRIRIEIVTESRE